MNPRHLTTAAVAFLFFCLIVGSTFNISNAPARYTGAPGEQTCTACHTGTVNQGPGMVSLMGPATYMAGATYSFTLMVTDTTQSRFGFSGTFLDASDLKAGNFVVTDPTFTSTTNSTVMGNQRQYIRHKAAHFKNMWSFDWTAPATATDTLRFYFTGNAANANSQTSGDNVYSNIFLLPPVGMAPSAMIQLNDSTPCEGDTVTFVEQIAGSANTLLWDFGFGANPAGAFGPGPHSVRYSNAASTAVTLVATNSFGSDTVMQPLRAFAIPAADAGMADTICRGDTLQLNGTATVGGNLQFQWSGTGFVDPDTLANARVAPDSSGYFVLAVNSDQCSGGATDSVFVGVNPHPVAAIMVSDSMICEGDSVMLMGIATGAGPGYTFAWTTTGQSLIRNSNMATTWVIPMDAVSTFSLTVDSEGCSDVVESQQIMLSPNPTPTVSLISPDSLSTQFAASYQWYFFDTLTMTTTLITGANGPFFSVSTNQGNPDNTGYVIVEVTDSNGCMGISDRFMLPMSSPVSRLLAGPQFSVFVPYGNSEGIISWEHATPGPASFLLFDVNGRKVFEEEFRVEDQTGEIEFPTLGLPNGYFIYQVIKEGKMTTGKIVLFT